jgi:hypothetical protein
LGLERWNGLGGAHIHRANPMHRLHCDLVAWQEHLLRKWLLKDLLGPQRWNGCSACQRWRRLIDGCWLRVSRLWLAAVW